MYYSDWFTPAAYTKDTVFGIYQFYYNDSTKAITQAILDGGVMITFGQLDGYVTAIWPTNLQIQFVDNLNLYSGISNAHKFRYVIIPAEASVAATSVKPGRKSGNGSFQTSSALPVPRTGLFHVFANIQILGEFFFEY